MLLIQNVSGYHGRKSHIQTTYSGAQSEFRTQECAKQVKLPIRQCQLHQRLFSYMFNGQGSSITVISTSILCLSLQYVVISSYLTKLI